MQSDDKNIPVPADPPASAAKDYVSRTNPRTREGEGHLKDGKQPQNGSGFHPEGLRPEQNSDWYGVRRPDPACSDIEKADALKLVEAAAAKKP